MARKVEVRAKPLLLAGLVGGLYDFTVATFGWWNENVTSRMIGFGETIADKAKLVFKVNTGAASSVLVISSV